MIVYVIEIVGGAFDGAPGLSWRGDSEHPAPDVIFVGVCSKGMDCGSASCRRGVAHVSYWTPDEDRPTGAHTYAKENEYVSHGDDGHVAGRVVYADGGLLDPANFGEAARELPGAGSRTLATARIDEELQSIVEQIERAGAPACVLAAARWHLGFADGRHDRGWAR